MFARFDKNPAMTLQVIKKTKRYRRTDGCTDNVKTVYPTTNKVCGGYNKVKNIGLYKIGLHAQNENSLCGLSFIWTSTGTDASQYYLEHC